MVSSRNRSSNCQIGSAGVEAWDAQSLTKGEARNLASQIADLLDADPTITEIIGPYGATVVQGERAQTQDGSRRSNHPVEPKSNNPIDRFGDFSADELGHPALVPWRDRIRPNELFGENG